MRLLVVTQTLDKNDPILGFFHRWVEELAKNFETVTVIALNVGAHELPQNVRVHTLGKELGMERMPRIMRYIALLVRLRTEYTHVFAHMNQEYVLGGGWLWRLLGKRVFLWRNHYAGSWLTDVAAALCDKVFCTSKYSYTAKYKKTVLMPVGVDTKRFFPHNETSRVPNSILFLSRMAPSKRPEILLDALAILNKKHIPFTADFYGSPRSEHGEYYRTMKEKVSQSSIGSAVVFHESVLNDKAPLLYRTHRVFVNCSPSGMFDKTIFEAAAAGAIVLATSEDWRDIVGNDFYFNTSADLANRLESMFKNPSLLSTNILDAIVDTHSLDTLISRLIHAMS